MIHHEMTADEISRTIDSLTSERSPSASRAGFAAEAVERALAERWITLVKADDVIWSWDPAPGVLRIERWCAVFGIPVRHVFDKPRGRMATGATAMAVADFAMLLIELERMGYRIDPTPLTTPLRAQLDRAARLTEAELAVLWFDQERNRMPPKFFRCPLAEAVTSTHRIALETGHVVTVESAHETPVGFHVAPPRLRRSAARAA